MLILSKSLKMPSPLYALDRPNTGYPILNYPQNLGNDPSRTHIVEFIVNDINPPTFNASEAKPGRQFNLFGQSFQISPPSKQIQAAIQLYMPDTVNVSYDQSYQEDNLSDYTVTYYGQALTAGFNSRDKIIEGLRSNPINTLSSNPEILALVRRFADNFIPVDTLLKGQGVAINPQVQLLFKATALRTFQFEFLFTPTSQQEAQNIKKIIQTFKYHAAPEIGGGATNSDLFFKMPDTFNINFLYKGRVNENVHKIDECVLETINVDYAPVGWSAFDDGAPVQTRMTLQFKELAVQDKKQIELGY